MQTVRARAPRDPRCDIMRGRGQHSSTAEKQGYCQVLEATGSPPQLMSLDTSFVLELAITGSLPLATQISDGNVFHGRKTTSQGHTGELDLYYLILPDLQVLTHGF